VPTVTFWDLRTSPQRARRPLATARSHVLYLGPGHL